jgi:DNA-binding transcriptional regulator GbsR (MarR family)
VSARQRKTSREVAPASGEAGPPGTAAASSNGIRPASGERTTPARDDRKPSPSGAARDPAAVRAFIERFTAKLAQTGFPRTPARIFVALLTSDSRTLTAAELADLLQTSPASISGGVRYLIQVGLVAAEGEPGSRRQHYWMSDRVWQDIVQLRERQFTLWAAELQDGVRILGADSPAGVRMADTVRYFEFITAEMAGLLARWDSLNQAADSG